MQDQGTRFLHKRSHTNYLLYPFQYYHLHKIYQIEERHQAPRCEVLLTKSIMVRPNLPSIFSQFHSFALEISWKSKLSSIDFTFTSITHGHRCIYPRIRISILRKSLWESKLCSGILSSNRLSCCRRLFFSCLWCRSAMSRILREIQLLTAQSVYWRLGCFW